MTSPKSRPENRPVNRVARIEAILQREFSPYLLEVRDESASHQGHAGWREGGETHIKIKIGAAVFAGCPRLASHRAIHAALAHEFNTGLHALSIVLV